MTIPTAPSSSTQPANDGCQRADRIGHVVGPVGKGHGAGGEDHQHGEDLFHTGEVEGLVGFQVQLDAAEQRDAEQRYQHADTQRDQHALLAGQLQADVLETLGHGHQRDHEAGEEHVQRDETLGVLERVIGVDDQLLHAHEQTEGDHPREHRRDHPAGDDRADGLPVHRIERDADRGEADHRADDRVGGGNRPALHGGDQQPGARGQERRHHAQHHQVRGDHLGVDDAVLDRFGDFAAGQVGTAELEDHGDEDRLPDGQRTRADRGAHGVGHVVGTHAPGHEETERAGEYQEYEAVIRDERHRRITC